MRDYNLAKAILFFVEQKIKDLWPLWWLLINVVIVHIWEFWPCNNYYNVNHFELILLRTIAIPIGFMFVEFFLMCILFALWQNTIDWITNNWEIAKEKAKNV
jgi:type VI protein secretion system component VasK